MGTIAADVHCIQKCGIDVKVMWTILFLLLFSTLFMVALCNRADHIYFHPVVCSSSSVFHFFPRLISVVGDWISTILPHMVWP